MVGILLSFWDNQLDDSKSLHRKWLFHQTSIFNWLFGVPGTCFEYSTNQKLRHRGKGLMQCQSHRTFAHEERRHRPLWLEVKPPETTGDRNEDWSFWFWPFFGGEGIFLSKRDWKYLVCCFCLQIVIGRYWKYLVSRLFITCIHDYM